VEVPKCLGRDDERCPFCTALQTQSECCGEWPAIISPEPAGEPVGLSIIEVPDMDHRIVNKATPHPARRVRLSLDLFEP
jgi:hypothetical protein